MTDRIVFEEFGLLPQGPTLSLAIGPGQSLAVVGPASAGKTSLLRCLAGLERPARGTVKTYGSVCMAEVVGFPRRATPESAVRSIAGTKHLNAIAKALTDTGTWALRQTPIANLSSGVRTLTSVACCLASPDEILVLDGSLDGVDPWRMPAVREALRERLRSGAGVVVATARPDLLAEFDLILVIADRTVRFVGSPDDLLRVAPETEIHVETVSQLGVRALLEPFSVSVRDTPQGLHVRAEEGQAVAARLLVEGYGDVQASVVRPPTFAEALYRIVR